MAWLFGKFRLNQEEGKKEKFWNSWDSLETPGIKWVKEKTQPDIVAVLESRKELERTIQLYEIVDKLGELYSKQYEENLSDDDCWLNNMISRRFNEIRKRGGTSEEITKLEDKIKDYVDVFSGEFLDKFLKIGWGDFFFDNLDLFEELIDVSTPEKLIKLGYSHKVFLNKDRFDWFEIDRTVAWMMIENKMISELIDDFWYFSAEDQISIIWDIIEDGKWEMIWNRLGEIDVLLNNERGVQEYLYDMLGRWVPTNKIREFRDNYYKHREERGLK